MWKCSPKGGGHRILGVPSRFLPSWRAGKGPAQLRHPTPAPGSRRSSFVAEKKSKLEGRSGAGGAVPGTASAPWPAPAPGPG